MKIFVSFAVFIIGISSAIGQISNLTEKFALPNSLSESSGVIFFNDKLITHNDSGGENKLYELDIISGLVTRTVTVSNAINVDWEDITQDDAFIYIGDIGNNSGNRTDLKIYKISKTDFINSTNITAELITFNYLDQTNFTENTNNTEWDSEALISFNATHLMLFSKNWVDGITKAYLMPKSPDDYSLTPLRTSLSSGGLITGGTYNPLSGKLYLVGYTQVLQPFVWVSENFNAIDVFSGTNTQTFLPILALEQTEAITYADEKNYFITSESFSIGPVSDYGKLLSFSTNDSTLSNPDFIAHDVVKLYPNPVKGILNIESKDMSLVEIYDTKLTRLYQGHHALINMSDFKAGLYFVKIYLKDNTFLMKRVIKK